MKFGVSGSTIRSDPGRLDELFWEGTDHIEIGLLPNRGRFEELLNKARSRARTVGVHSPLLVGGSKYDLLESVDYPTERAWDQVAHEAGYLAGVGASYLLVHFPYFRASPGDGAAARIEEGLERLAAIQRESGTPIVCEPKLGASRDPGGIDTLRTYPVEQWASSSLALCWDVGDFLIALDGAAYTAQWARWERCVSVVHLHNVLRNEPAYRWVPAHPDYDADDAYFDLAPVIRSLPGRERTIVLEHTPHDGLTAEVARGGFAWVRNLIGEREDR